MLPAVFVPKIPLVTERAATAARARRAPAAWACGALAAAALAIVAGCGAGDGTKRELPAGPPTSAGPGPLVLYASLGQANQVVAYRLGADGLLPADPFSAIDLENPRRMLLNGNILYVLLPDRVVSIAINNDGSLPSIPTSVTAVIEEGNPLDLALFGDVLYVAYEDLEQLIAYRLVLGHVPAGALSASGTGNSDYQAVAANQRFVFAATPRERSVHTYLKIGQGALPVDPQSEVARIDFPDDMLIHNGVLYAADGIDRRILGWFIPDTGILPEDPDFETLRVESYVEMVINDDLGLLYASGFNRGRLDTFRINPIDGSFLDDKPVTSTAQDVASFPNGMDLAGGILYVALAGRDRIDAYIVASNGALPRFPSSSTNVIPDAFPNDAKVGLFPTGS